MLARRAIQKLIDQSPVYLTAAQIARFVQHLDRNSRDSIEAEWEVITLTGLASVGGVEYEADLGGPARVDVRFRSSDLKFVADLTAVSDEEYDRENPVQELADYIGQVASKLRDDGIQGTFHFRVQGIPASVRHRAYKRKLLMPYTHRFPSTILDDRFRKFEARIRAQPEMVHRYAVEKPDTSIQIVFTPSPGSTLSYTYLTYNLPHHADHNVVYQALKRKSEQIKQAGQRQEGELAGVILCDGDCGMLRVMRGVNNLSLDQVVRAFLRRTKTVDFVCVVDIVPSRKPGSSRRLQFDVRGWAKQQVSHFLLDTVRQAFKTLPPPINTAINTLNNLRFAGTVSRRFGRYKGTVSMSAKSIELSLSAVMDYIAGSMDRAEFERICPKRLA